MEGIGYMNAPAKVKIIGWSFIALGLLGIIAWVNLFFIFFGSIQRQLLALYRLFPIFLPFGLGLLLRNNLIRLLTIALSSLVKIGIIFLSIVFLFQVYILKGNNLFDTLKAIITAIISFFICNYVKRLLKLGEIKELFKKHNLENRDSGK